MITVAPTILVPDVNTFAVQANLFTSFAKRVQLDIVDGSFAPIRTVSLREIKQLPNSSDCAWDLHMMVSTPSNHLVDIIRLHPSLCIFPAEVDEKLQPLFDELQANGIKTGIALLKATFPGNLTSLIKTVDHVIIFAGTLGKQGGIADLIQTEKVPIIQSINPSVEIGWDGGANLKNIRTIANSGVKVINVGSAIAQSSDPLEAFKALNAESERPGVLL